MRTLTAWSILVLASFTIMFAAGCRDEAEHRDEVAVTLDEIETVQHEILAEIEQRIEHAAAEAVAAQNAQVMGGIRGIRRGPFPPTTIKAAQQQLRTTTTFYSNALDALRQAHAHDTWDVLACDSLALSCPPGASARSIVLTYLRDLEDERTHLENLAAESQP